uniref:Dof zinc finger protein n=1 Tax=Ananas comosus var. bracteatus TaxID=296719 RepID=A0A6V7PZE6_ANACO|nr:unnamed protein product [Ananas comosus var. bracteatus]
MGLISQQSSVSSADWSRLGMLSGSGGIEAPKPLPRNQLQRPQIWPPLRCPRCDSTNTKFCYYNNYSRLQPRYLCKACRRHWTEGAPSATSRFRSSDTPTRPRRDEQRFECMACGASRATASGELRRWRGCRRRPGGFCCTASGLWMSGWPDEEVSGLAVPELDLPLTGDDL